MVGEELSNGGLADPDGSASETLIARAGHLSAYSPWPSLVGPAFRGLGVAPPSGLVSVLCIDRPPGGPGRKPGSACLM